MPLPFDPTADGLDVREDVDADAIRGRARTTHLEPPTVEEAHWMAEDPETDCRGVGDREAEARRNLVWAVAAYRVDREDDVSYMSAGRAQTVKMTWLESGPSLLARLRERLF